MKTFRKYDKIYRIEMPNYPIKGKYHLAKKQEQLLLRGNCIVTEKVDGANTGIFCKKDKWLQKKRANIDFSHPQFSFFQNEWYWNNKEKIKQLPDNIVVYGELLRCVHTIYYNRLPDWWIVFDIYDLKKNKYKDWKEVINICEDVGLYTVPFIYEGKIKSKNQLLDLMSNKSKFGDRAEGIVVKNYRQQATGKYVKPEFRKEVECDDSKHWISQKIRLNAVI